MVDPNYPGFHGLKQDSSPLQYCGSARRYTPTRSPEQKQRSQHQQQQPSSSSSSSGHYYYNRQHSNNSHKLSLTLLSKHRQPSLISTSTIFGSKKYCDMDYPVKGRGLYQSHHHSHRASSPSHPPLHRSISPGASGSPQTPPPHPGGVLTTSICDTKFLLTGSGPNSRDGGGGESSLSHHEPLGSTNSVRKVHIIKSPDDPPDVGLTLCGGLEVGLGGTIFISRVAEDSIAEKSGLCPGDQILSINYTSFLDQSVTCQKALHMICSQDCLTFTILPRREALTSHRRNVAYNWVDPEGRPVSPPPPDRDFNSDTELDLLGEPGGPSASSRVTSSPRRRQSHSNRSCEQIVRTVKIIIEKGINPGLMIRGGLEYGLGIYVTGVESMSAAERGGLKIGDQILFVNNHDFRNVLHDEAVDILRSSPRLTMKVRYVGKTPASNASLVISSSSTNSHLTSSDGSTSSASHADYPLNRIPSSSRCSLNSETRRINRSSCSSRHTSSGTGSPGYRSISEQGTNHVTPTLLVTESAEEELLEEKLNQLLPEKDRITFAYYRNEYETKGMTVDAFIALFLELLDTREKYSLLNHFRSIIREEDLDKFDELIYKREEQAMIKSKANPIEAAHMIADDEDLSDCSISFPHESIGNGHHKENDSIPLDTKSSKITSSPIERSSSRNGNNSARFGRDINSLSPLPFNKDSVPRRHSSCNPEKDISNCNDFLTIPTNPDERRWSIAASHDLPSKYNKDSAYGYRENLRERSLSGVEMKSNGRDNTIHHQRTSSSNHLQIPNVNNNIYHSADQLPETGYHSSLQSKVRRHSSLPGPCSTNPFNKPSSPFHCQPHRSSSFRIPHHRSVREPDGKLRVIVKKSKPILGLAIEGGSDVPSQLQPRIISIHSSGAAFDTGDLHVGHIILEVDGVSTANMSHEEVAQMMAMAYYNTPYKDHIEFVVREKSKNEFDIRRSSFMLLNNSFE